jgi:hypothetical protein
MWHTHILASTEKYHLDNMKMNGRILEHDDSLNDRTEGSSLNTNFEKTRSLWERIYGEEYKVPGGMYRGEPPIEYYNVYWVDEALTMAGSQPNPDLWAPYPNNREVKENAWVPFSNKHEFREHTWFRASESTGICTTGSPPRPQKSAMRDEQAWTSFDIFSSERYNIPKIGSSFPQIHPSGSSVPRISNSTLRGKQGRVPFSNKHETREHIDIKTAGWTSIDAPGSFIPQLPKSSVRGGNANPYKDGYVFGTECEYSTNVFICFYVCSKRHSHNL